MSVIERFQALESVIREHRETAEQSGRLSDTVVEALTDAGINRLFLPKSLGGFEIDPVRCAEITEWLAHQDTAAAWFVMVGNTARLMASTWPESLVEELWLDDPDCVVAASGNVPLTGVREGDGFRASGVNRFVSGCHHARWFLTPMLVDGEPRMAILPMEQCEIVDNWDALGMRGTGSNDVRADGVWVPATRTLSFTDGPVERNRYYQGPLYRCPGRVVFATYVPITLVLAEQALTELDKLARNKTPYAQDAKLKHRSVAQIKYGKALATHRATYTYFMNALEEAWRRAEEGTEATAEQKGDLYLAGTHAVQASSEVVRLVADAAASSVIYKDHPLERIVRDMETLRHHGFANESRYGSVAQLYWGAELDYPLMLR